MKKAIHHVMLN